MLIHKPTRSEVATWRHRTFLIITLPPHEYKLRAQLSDNRFPKKLMHKYKVDDGWHLCNISNFRQKLSRTINVVQSFGGPNEDDTSLFFGLLNNDLKFINMKIITKMFFSWDHQHILLLLLYFDGNNQGSN